MVNYGIIGVGAVFEVFQVQSLLRMKEIKLYAASDVNEDRLKYVQQKYGFEKIYTDYHKMLNDKYVFQQIRHY